MMQQRSMLVLIVGCLIASGCSGRNPNWKQTYPVTGQVFADGQPAKGVTVVLHPVEGLDTTQPTMTSAMTDEEGKFSTSTYEEGDGAPEGEYIVTFEWGELNRMSMAYVGDKFDGKYSNPKKSEFKVTVSAGDTADMGRIELSTK